MTYPRGRVFDEGGVGIEGATVTLQTAVLSGEGSTVAITGNPTTTDADGYYGFPNAPATAPYDVKVQYGNSVRRDSGLAHPTVSFVDTNIDAAADIALTKLNQGTADETVDPTTYSPTTLNGFLSKVVAQIKAITGGAHWYSAPSASLAGALRRADAGTGQRVYCVTATVSISSGTKVGSTTVGLGSLSLSALASVQVTPIDSALSAGELPVTLGLRNVSTTGFDVYAYSLTNVASTRAVTVYCVVHGS